MPPAVGGVCSALLLLCACGHSAPAGHSGTAHGGAAQTGTAHGGAATRRRPVTPCSSDARNAFVGFLRVPPASVVMRASTGSNAMPQCSFRARVANGRRITAVANINTGPQPYFVLERTAIEAGQQFGAKRLVPVPQAVTGLGLEADWFPAQTQLMTTDGIRLVTVSINWPGTSQARRRALAEAVARRYLKHT